MLLPFVYCRMTEGKKWPKAEKAGGRNFVPVINFHILPSGIFYHFQSFSTFSHSTFGSILPSVVFYLQSLSTFIMLHSVIFYLQSFYVRSFYIRSFNLRSFYVWSFYVRSRFPCTAMVAPLSQLPDPSPLCCILYSTCSAMLVQLFQLPDTSPDCTVQYQCTSTTVIV